MGHRWLLGLYPITNIALQGQGGVSETPSLPQVYL